MNEIIYSADGKKRGEIQEINGKRVLFDASGRKIGEYDPETNATHDRNGSKCKEEGNRLVALLEWEEAGERSRIEFQERWKVRQKKQTRRTAESCLSIVVMIAFALVFFWLTRDIKCTNRRVRYRTSSLPPITAPLEGTGGRGV